LCDFAQTLAPREAKLRSRVNPPPQAHILEREMNNVRIERMLRELHAGPPLRFFEDIFALRDIVAGLVAEMRISSNDEARPEMLVPQAAR